MTLLCVLSAVLLTAAPPNASSLYAAGQAAFAKGDVDKAVAHLDTAAAAAKEQGDSALQVQVHLLRGQCFAALPNGTPRAEAAFLEALTVDPEASLDPAKVRPSIIALLDGVRARATGDLTISSNVAIAEAFVDGVSVGTVPVTKAFPIGRHVVDVRATDQTSDRMSVMVRPGPNALQVPMTVALVAPPPPPAPESGLRLFLDARFGLEPAPPSGTGLSGGWEVGVGLGGEYLLGSVHAGLSGTSFAFTLRATGTLMKLFSVVGVHLSLDVPFMVLNGSLAAGVGGSGGVDFTLTRWLEPYVEAQYRHFVALPTPPAGSHYVADVLLLGAGVRLRWP